MSRLVVIDQKAVIYCGHFKSNIFTLQEGSFKDGKYIIPSMPAGGTAYCLTRLIELYKQDATTDFIVCNDTKTNFRKVLYPAYKSTREKYKSKDKKMFIQSDSDLLTKILKQIGINSYTKELFEADDLIATTIERFSNKYDEIILVAEDSDLNALLRPNITKIGVKRGYQPVVYDVNKRFEYTSIEKALEGDVSDDIPKLNLPSMVWEIYSNLTRDIISNKQLVRLLVDTMAVLSEDQKEDLRRNIDLAYMVKDIDIDLVPTKLNITRAKLYLRDLDSPIIPDSEKLKLLKGEL